MKRTTIYQQEMVEKTMDVEEFLEHMIKKLVQFQEHTFNDVLNAQALNVYMLTVVKTQSSVLLIMVIHSILILKIE